MIMLEADHVMSQLWPGKYRSLNYSITTFEDSVEYECKVYVDKLGYHTGKTFEEAIKKLVLHEEVVNGTLCK